MSRARSARFRSDGTTAPSDVVPLNAGTDPVLELIQKYLGLEMAIERAPDADAIINPLVAEQARVRKALAKTAPNTFAGMAALARFLDRHSTEVLRGKAFFDNDREHLAFYASFDRACAGLVTAGSDAKLLRLGARLDEKIAAFSGLDADYRVRLARFEGGKIAEADFRAAEEPWAIIRCEIDALWNRLKRIRATTIEGLRIKARYAKLGLLTGAGNALDMASGRFASTTEEVGFFLINDLLAAETAKEAV